METKLKYKRYKAEKLIGDKGREALRQYVEHYNRLAADSPDLLNQKIPRKTFKPVLEEIGILLKRKATELTASSPDICAFLDRNSLPECLGTELTREVRAFALLLNALKQWTNAEQAAMDRFLVSGNVRNQLRKIAHTCPITGRKFGCEKIELHHPVRDGRPPIPLSKTGHKSVEGLFVPEPGDQHGAKFLEHRKNPHQPY